MMKKIFTLIGVDNTGKTTKVKQLAEWVRNNYSAVNQGINFSDHEIFGVLQVNKLKIGFISAGDNLGEVMKIEELFNEHKDNNNENENDIDIIVNSCRTKGAGRKYLQSNFNRSTGWLPINIYVEKINPASPALQIVRDNEILVELKTWLTGLEKL